MSQTKDFLMETEAKVMVDEPNDEDGFEEEEFDEEGFPVAREPSADDAYERDRDNDGDWAHKRAKELSSSYLASPYHYYKSFGKDKFIEDVMSSLFGELSESGKKYVHFSTGWVPTMADEDDAFLRALRDDVDKLKKKVEAMEK